MKPKSISQADYARHARLSRARVCQLMKLGMPLDSIASADRWRGITKPRKIPKRPEGATNRPSKKLSKEDSLAGLLERCRAIELQAYKAAIQAVESGRGVTRAFIAHNKSARSLAEISPTIARLQQRESNLLSREWVRRFVNDHDPLVIGLIEAMPDLLAPRINPADPDMVRAELRTWANSAVKSFRESNPFAEESGK